MPPRNRRLNKLLAELQRKNQIRNHLEREVLYTEKSTDRGEKDWTKLCSEIRVTELKEQLQHDMQESYRILDRKNHYIEVLKDAIKEADEQYDRQIQHHGALINYFTELFVFFIKSLENNYNNDKLLFVSDHHSNKFWFMYYWCPLIDDSFQQILHNSNKMSFESLDAMKEEFYNKKELIQDTHFLKKYETLERWVQMLMLDEIKKIMLSKWNQTRTPKKRLKNFYKRLKETTSDYDDFRSMEQETEKYEKELPLVEKALLSLECECTQKLSDLMHQRTYLIWLYWHLKKVHEENASNDNRKLKQLSVLSYNVKKGLMKYLKKGNSILAIAAVCRKHETQLEKIITCPDKDIKSDDWKSSKSSFDPNEFDKTTVFMEKFYYRMAKIKIHNLELLEEKRRFTMENQRLQNLIRQYCHHQKYNKNIQALQLSSRSVIKTSIQEASHLPQLKAIQKKFSESKQKTAGKYFTKN